MKLLLILVISLFSLQAVAQTELESEYVYKSDTLWVQGEMVYQSYLVDEEPVFPGGFSEMKRWIDNEMRFPTERCVEGRCYLKITVLSSGKIAQAEILRGIPGCPECDKEAKRLALKMPLWKPATFKGKPVASEMNIPITFKIL